MCLITFSLRRHPKYYLVLVANRDEFYKRPTQPSHWWGTYPDILAGRDEQAGGTWMGINKQGDWAAITNVRAPGNYNENAPSRGDLVKDFLLQSPAPRAYLKTLSTHMRNYNGFNLILGNAEEAWYLTNSIKRHQPQPLLGDLYGLSNDQLNTPWPKVERACVRLDRYKNQSKIDSQELINELVDTSIAPDEELPSTGVPQDLERQLSAMFIQTPEYGTRCSTVLLIGYDGTVQWREHSYIPGSLMVEHITQEEFEIQ
ncbi:MAG: NRDE family protein [Bacteroidota bacterium]